MEIIATKLLPPRLKPGMIKRSILDNPLMKDNKIILITAPAGYGKTTLMLQLLQQYELPSVWYQLDTYDNDPAVFLQYFTAGFQRHLPEFGKEILGIINQGDFQNKLRLILGFFINSLVRSNSEFIIVLDDFHVINEPVIQRFVQEFMELLPENVYLFIAGRRPINLSNSRLATNGNILIVNTEQLRFSRNDIKEYFKTKQLNPEEELVDYLEENTDGWPIALGLAKAFPVFKKNELFLQRNKEIYSYLAGEVFNQQPEAIRDFLLVTSVLEVLTPEHCNLLLERNDSLKILDYLERQQLFLITLEGSTKAYRYHHLFREFLRSRLVDISPDLMRRAGEIAFKSGEYDQMIDIFTAIGIDREAVTTIETAVRKFMNQGRWLTVSRWLKALPSATISENPWLLLYQAQVRLYQYRLGEVGELVEQALSLFSQTGDENGLAEARLVQARKLRHLGKYRDSLEYLEAAEFYLAKMGPRVDLPLEKSILFYLTGRLTEAESFLLEVLKAAERLGDGYMIANLLEGLGNIYYLQGDYQKALQIYKKGLQLTPDSVLPGYYAMDFIALIHQDWGELEPALEYAKQNLAFKEKLGMVEAIPLAYMHLGIIQVDLGELEAAEEYYRQAFYLNRENGKDSFYLALNLVFWARSLALLHRFSEARIKVEEAIKEAGSEPNLALANCLAVGGMVVFLIGDLVKAEEMLRQGTAMLEEMGFRKGLCYAYEMSAALYFETGKLDLAHEYSGKALELAAKLNDLQVFITFYKILAPVLKYGLENGIELSFIYRVLSRLGSDAAKLLIELGEHTDPEVRKRIIIPLAELGPDLAGTILHRLIKDDQTQVAELARAVSLRMGIIRESNNEQLVTERLVSLGFHGLGPLRISLNNQDITYINWRTEKARDLLIYLAHKREPVDKERIIEDLWPEDQTSTSTLFSTVYRLRRVLDKSKSGELVLFKGGKYQLLPECYEADWLRFERSCASIAATRFDDSRKVNLLEETLSLYRGQYLEEFDYPWLLPYQEHYKNLFLQTGLSLVRLYIETKDFQKATKLLNRLLETNNFLEEAHILMLTAHAGMGDRVGVIRYYQKITDLFHLELGLLPPAKATELFQTIVGD